MKKLLFLTMVLTALLAGCASWSESKQEIYSTNSVPLTKRYISEYPVIIISTRGPQLSPDSYEVLGEISSKVNNVTVFEKRGTGAVELLRNEAKQVGAHAIINVQVGQTQFGSTASGVAIRFKNYDEAIRSLKEIGAVIL